MIVFLYIVCCLVSWVLFILEWRHRWDTSIRDMCFHGVMSIFGPFSLFAALVVFCVGVFKRHGLFGVDLDKVIFKKRG